MSSGSRWRWRPTNFPSLQTLVIILSCLACLPHNTVARDAVTADEPLKDGDTLVSSGETFELGFFRPGRSSNLTFLGIWYKHVQAADRAVVWVANRDCPLMDSSGVLQIGNQGNVVLVNGSGGVVWSSNMTTARRPVLQLLDTGNLVVVRDHDQITIGEEVEGVMKQDQAECLWQSFDYPSDTLLPGMKLGWDMRIGLERKLTSWRSSDDPSPGGHTFAIEPHGLPQAYLLHGTTLKYRSGPWNGLRFSGVPEMKSKDMFDFRFVAGADEVYYSYDVIDRSMLSRLKVTHDGVLKRLTWVEQSKSWNLFWSAPKDQCDEYAECGPYGVCNTDDSPVCECSPGFEPKSPEKWNLRDGSDGCVRSTLLMTTEECGGGGSSFVRLTGMKLPETKGALVDRGARGLGECEAACRRNCSCMGYAPADVRGGGSGCVWWDGDLVDMRAYDADGGQDMYLRVPASVLGGSGHDKKKMVVIVAVSASAAALALLAASVVVFVRKRIIQKRSSLRVECAGIREMIRSQELGPSTQTGSNDTEEEHRKEDYELPLLDLSTVMTATNNFSEDNKLGQGGFGPVYKGKLPTSDQEVAVKRLSKNSGQGLDEFKNEVMLIAKLQHRNLVRLLGCCIQGEEKMLVYEYMPNKSLNSFIFDEAKRRILDWRLRFNIIMGIARGLLYLHQDSRFRIIHRDLKASNILLDNKMTPKISDFGMARIFGGDETEGNTKRVVGTYGYMSPEYAMDGLFSVKSDVFSFGVLVLEIVSGQKNRGFYQMGNDANLLARAWRLWREGRGLEVMDETIVNDSHPISEVSRCIQVGLLCVQERAEDRPTMSTVVFMLGSENPTLPQPKEPGYCTGRREETENDLSAGKQESITVNHVTVTVMRGR